ncbi:MAG: putative methylase [Acidobacteriota bacterium]|jgi:putative DNA methylase|nr:putative methylase [Acidobacteriota bacterium]
MKTHKKLIEVALPLDAINTAAAAEKQPGIGAHPRGLHLWWARRPLAAARAVIFSQMVDDPLAYVDVLLGDAKKRRKAEALLKARRKVWEEARAVAQKAKLAGIETPAPGPEPTLEGMTAEIERERLFEIIRKLVLWENTTNESVLQEAREEIWQSWRRTCAENADHPRAKELFDRHKLPAFHDPFAGGGALPLEAQRLGLEAYASDLNPVAVLINKAMIEIPPKFAGKPPVNPQSRKKLDHSRTWCGVQGLADDVRYYGQWMRDEAKKRMGHLYRKIPVTTDMEKERPDLRPYVGKELTVIAWLWARTVKSPNPAFRNIDVPLASTFMLSTKQGKEVYVEPVIGDGGYRFTVKVGKPKDAQGAKSGTKLSQGSFRCLMSDHPFRYEYIDDEANAGRMGARLMAVVAEGNRGRVYLSPTDEMERAAASAKPTWKPDLASRGTWASNAQGRTYGFRTFGDYFTPRQLVALTTFSDLVQEARDRVLRDALTAGLSDDGKPLNEGGAAAMAYSDAVGTYLALAIDRLVDYNSSLATWKPSGAQVMQTFKRQALPMTWDFPESNVLGESAICWHNAVKYSADSLEVTGSHTTAAGVAILADAASQSISQDRVVATDPPYYDNIGYADLSDFFYVWLRRSLRTVFPELFATLAVPKAAELVATPYRHGSKEKAEHFFLDGMTHAMNRLASHSHPAFPVTIYYAFKQAENDATDGTTNTSRSTT